MRPTTRSTTRPPTAAILLGALMAALMLSVAACNHAASRSDAAINSDIQARLTSDAAVPGKQITVQTANGVATLSGTVASQAQRRVAADDAAGVAGVRTVVNNLTVGATQTAPQPVATQAAAPAPPQPSASQRRAERRRELAARRAAKRAAERSARRQREAARREREREEAAARSRRRAEQARASYPRYEPAPAPAPYSQPVRQQSAPAPRPSYAQAAPPPPAYQQQTYTPPQRAVTPPPPPAAPAYVTIPAGTPLVIRLLDPLDSATSYQGDTFRATLSQPVWLNGNAVIPPDAELLGRVTEAQAAGRMRGAATLSIELMRVRYNGHSYVIHTDQWSRTIQGRGKNTAEKVGGGAALGAIIGALAGGGKGAGIGALVGGGAGGTAQALSHPKQVVLAPETRISFRLSAPVQVRPSAINRRNANRPRLD